MEREGFIFTIFFLTLGPVKIIPAFAKLTYSMPLLLKRDIAIKGILIAAAICAFVVLLGEGILRTYDISLEALEIAAGLVLLLSALNAIFPRLQPCNPPQSELTALQLAISPVASPVVVPPVGVAAILIFIVGAPRYPGMNFAIARALLIILAMDFLVMFFIDKITGIPGLLLLLQVFGAALVFIQVALAVETILDGFRSLGVFSS